ncbi:hypothetical protein XfasM23_1581 [Xylella fastidiosa M23]|uniref:Integrase n=1 Tax=Xylella fastidiosa (strain M23) TaxID=405441 RepID=B2I715_XYLF2|nr:hypothetical protein XfasM23_1581 [Xylella fastidiosa M23]
MMPTQLKETVPKVIRHTMATELRSAGVAAQDIQGMLGHRAYGGTTDVYAKYRPDYMADAVRAIDAYMRRLRVSCVSVNKPQIAQPIDSIGGRCRVRTCDPCRVKAMLYR